MKSFNGRRSIRKYTDQVVSEDSVNLILKAAMAAPSAGNQQPWHFVVVRDREILKKLEDIHPHGKMTGSCNVAVVVCGNNTGCKYADFWVQDCSAATENLLLAVHELGLGAVWCGVYPEKERCQSFSRVLELPFEVIPFALIPVGYPGEEKSCSDRFDEQRIHYDQW